MLNFHLNLLSPVRDPHELTKINLDQPNLTVAKFDAAYFFGGSYCCREEHGVRLSESRAERSWTEQLVTWKVTKTKES